MSQNHFSLDNQIQTIHHNCFINVFNYPRMKYEVLLKCDFFSCLNKRPPDIPLLLRHIPSLGRVYSVEGNGEKIRCDNNLQNVQQKLANATADAENVTFLTECTEYNCARLSLLSGVLAWKMMKCPCGCCILVLPECSYLFCTPYRINFPTNEK